MPARAAYQLIHDELNLFPPRRSAFHPRSQGVEGFVKSVPERPQTALRVYNRVYLNTSA
jgi:hypothetical protein